MSGWRRRNKAFKGTGAAQVDPYEDWEFATRPGDGGGPFWQPVYITLAPLQGRYAPAAQALLDHMADPGALALGEDAQRLLAAFLTDEAAGKTPDPHLFVYRPERLSYVPLTDPGDGRELYKVRHVGVALPGEFVVRNPRAAPPAAASETRADIVLTAVIDDAIAFAHERFRHPDHTTRVERVWLQAVDGIEVTDGHATVAIGQEFDKSRIDALLTAAPTEPAFYRALRREAATRAAGPGRAAQAGGHFAEPGYRRPVGGATSHGTLVMDLAGGFPCGAAPANRPLVAVELPGMATLDTSGARLHSYALQALMRVLHWADSWTDPDTGRPVRVSLVVNFSFGVTAGPKDGTGFLEREMARLVDARNAAGAPTKLVVPAGNNYRDRLTAAAQIAPGASAAFDWRVQPGDKSVSFLELRLPKRARAELTLDTPGGSRAKIRTHRDAVYEWTGAAGAIGAVYVQPAPSVEGQARITVALAPTSTFTDRALRAPAGRYGITVRNLSDAGALPLWADVQRDDTPGGYPAHGRQSYLEDAAMTGVDPDTRDRGAPTPGSAIQRRGTMSAFATSGSAHVFAVGGAVRGAAPAPARYTASGPTRGPLPGDPALSALTEDGTDPGGILAAGSFSGSAAALSGTSAAAPQAARAIVDVLQRTPHADRAAILTALTGSAAGADPDRLGHGTLPRGTGARDRGHR